jgi:hypothetical protein
MFVSLLSVDSREVEDVSLLSLTGSSISFTLLISVSASTAITSFVFKFSSTDEETFGSSGLDFMATEKVIFVVWINSFASTLVLIAIETTLSITCNPSSSRILAYRFLLVPVLRAVTGVLGLIVLFGVLLDVVFVFAFTEVVALIGLFRDADVDGRDFVAEPVFFEIRDGDKVGFDELVFASTTFCFDVDPEVVRDVSGDCDKVF